MHMKCRPDAATAQMMTKAEQVAYIAEHAEHGGTHQPHLSNADVFANDAREMGTLAADYRRMVNDSGFMSRER